MLSESPRFNAARRYGAWLLSLGVAFAVFGALLLTIAVPASAPWRPLGYLGAALWAAAAGFLPAAIFSFARQRLLAAAFDGPQPDAPASQPTDRTTTQRLLSALRARLELWVRDNDALTRWPPVLVSTFFALLTLAAVREVWGVPPQATLDPLSSKIAAAVLVVMTFPLLLLERSYANLPAEQLPEAPQLNRLLRLPVATCLVLAITQILLSSGFGWAAGLARIVGVLIFLVAIELILRNAAALFLPFAPIELRQSLADSSLSGGLLRLRVPTLRTINVAVRRRLGIDLSRSWALAFIQKAALPAVVGMGLLAWAVTGITALGINERGIYERLGVPVAVLPPGLHIHLPWPLGIVRPVEFGVVHLLPIEFLLPGGIDASKSSRVGESDSAESDSGQPGPAEGPAPESADRLWSGDHPFEGNYLIASAENGKQSFQLVDIDMAVLYRVGFSDAAVRAAAYRLSDADELIQALCGQLLVRYFTRNTLLDLLGKSRESFTRQFQAALQGELNRFSTGIEVSGVSVEAIHPPPGAASAYHDVQAAEIRANIEVSTSRSAATRTLMTARQTVIEDHNEGVAAAAERVGQARSQSVLFAGERQAYAQDGYPFLLESWLAALTKGLGQSEFVLVDHRLTGPSMPALDVRNLSNPPASDTAPPPAEP